MKWNAHSKYGCIRTQHKRLNGENQGVAIKSPFCEGAERVCVKINEDSIRFTLAPFDYLGKTYSVSPNSAGWYSISCWNSIPVGVYPIDEEDSTVDEWVCYFEDVVK